MKQKKQNVLSSKLIVFLALVVFVITGYFFYQKLGTLTSTSQTSQISPVIAETTVNWQTFTNSQGKISFKYPSRWKINNAIDFINLSNETSTIRFQLSQYPSIDFDALYEKPYGTVNQNPVFIRTKIKNLTIDGYKATMYTNESSPANQNKGFDISLYFVKDAPVTMVSAQTELNSKEELLSIFNQVISTIKFTK